MTLSYQPGDASSAHWPGLLQRYRQFLPIRESTPIVTLNEGNTPLVLASRLQRQLGIGVRLYFKLEGANPTGSFKDRGMTMAVSKACEAGAEAIICASTGNTSASMAAYAARAGIRSYMLVPHGYVALGKLAQGLHYGAQVLSIEGNFDQALELVRALSARYPVTLVNSVNPDRIEGQKTAAFEVVDALGDAPDILALPVGNAGNITAYWKGFKEYQAAGVASRLPRLHGYQAAGAASLVIGSPVVNPETVATAIRIGNPASAAGAKQAIAESHGTIAAVSDDEILEAYDLLAREEGLFCEPASAASFAGILKQAREGCLANDSNIVCILTGNGLKDPERAIGRVSQPLLPLPASLSAVARSLGW